MKMSTNLIFSAIFLAVVLVLAYANPGAVSAQYYNYGACTYHAYRECVGNNVYWFNSCGNQQDLYQSCVNGQVCQYGQCVAYVQPIVQPQSTYVAYYRTACSGNNVYWYDSLGVRSGLNKNCADANSCTVDTCSASKCENTLKCDGTTCATDSADYKTYCPVAQPVVPVTPTPVPAPTPTPAPEPTRTPAPTAAVVAAPAAQTGFWGFVGRWFMWILATAMLIFLFVVVFKRFSSDV